MSVRSFRPVIAVATVAAAALGCYLVSLRVATERAHLEEVETRIVLAQRDIRMLQTEIGTRGRLEQLERWNVKVLALAAPKADQFVDGGYQLARLARPDDEIRIDAPVVMASVPKPRPAQPLAEASGDLVAPAPRAAPVNRGPASMMHVASYAVTLKPATPAPAKPSAAPSPKPSKVAAKAEEPSTKTAGAKPKAPAAPTRSKATASPKHAPASGGSKDAGTHR